MSEDTEHNAKWGAIIFLIFVLVIIILMWYVWSVYDGQNQRTQERLDAGCTPEAWSWSGTPTIWSCPVR